jgi:hypothetical protein
VVPLVTGSDSLAIKAVVEVVATARGPVFKHLAHAAKKDLDRGKVIDKTFLQNLSRMKLNIPGKNFKVNLCFLTVFYKYRVAQRL